MFRVVPLEKQHVHQMLIEPWNKDLDLFFNDSYVESVTKKTNAHAAFFGDDLLFCFGISAIWTGRGHVWLLLGSNIKKHPLAFFRGAKKLIQACQFHRLEIDQPPNLARGFDLESRRFKELGFVLEVPLAKKYYPNEQDASIYVWVRK